MEKEALLNKKIFLRHWKGDPGHVSLQTDKHYISFWPGENLSKESNFAKTVQGKFNTYEEDKSIEKKEEDEKITLKNLDVETINNEYEKFCQSNAKWSIFASSLLKETDETKNCSGLIAHLLLMGGADLNTIKKNSDVTKNCCETIIVKPGQILFLGSLILAALGGGWTVNKFKEMENSTPSNKFAFSVGVILLAGSIFVLMFDIVRCSRRVYQGRIFATTPNGITRAAEELYLNYSKNP